MPTQRDIFEEAASAGMSTEVMLEHVKSMYGMSAQELMDMRPDDDVQRQRPTPVPAPFVSPNVMPWTPAPQKKKAQQRSGEPQPYYDYPMALDVDVYLADAARKESKRRG